MNTMLLMFAEQKDGFCLGPQARLIYAAGGNNRRGNNARRGAGAGNRAGAGNTQPAQNPGAQQNTQANPNAQQGPQARPNAPRVRAEQPAPTPEQLDEQSLINQDIRAQIQNATQGAVKLKTELDQYTVKNNAEKIKASKEKIDAAVAEIEKSRVRLRALPREIQAAYADLSKKAPKLDPKILKEHLDEYKGEGQRKNLQQNIQAQVSEVPDKFTQEEANNLLDAYDEGPQGYVDLLNEYFAQHRFGNPDDLTDANQKAQLQREIDKLQEKLLSLTPKTPEKKAEDFQEIINAANATPDGEIAATKLQNLLNDEQNLVGAIDLQTDKINEEAKKLDELAMEAYEEVNARAKAEVRLRDVQRQTGLPLTRLTKEYPGGKTIHGEEIIFEMPERRYSEAEKKYELVGKRTLKISKVAFGPLEEEIDGEKVNFPSLTPVFHVQWQNMPAIDINGWSASGERVMSDFQLREYLLEKEGVQVIHDLKALAKNLNLSPDRLKKGQKFEYLVYNPDVGGKAVAPTTKTCTIEAVNLEKGTITLNEEVVIDKESQYSTSELNKPKKELTFGEFSKFYLKTEMLPELANVKELNEALVNLNAKLNHELERKKDLYPPVYLIPDRNGKIAPPLILMSDRNPPEIFTVNAVEDNKVKFTDPAIEPKSFNEFFRWTKDTDIEIGDPVVRAKRGEELHAGPDATPAEKAAAAAAEKKAAEEQQAAADKLAKENAEKKAAGEPVVTAKKPQSIISDSYMRQLWTATSFLSARNVKDIFTKIFELGKGWMDQRHDLRTGAGGHALTRNLPFGLGAFFGSNFLSQQNAANAKAVQALIDQWATLDPAYVIDKLYKANTLVELKAAFQKVSEYGIIRWHEKRLHDVLNRLIVRYWPPGHPLAGKRIVIPYPLENTEKNLVYQDYLRAMLDLQFSSGTYDGLVSTNKGSYEKDKSASQANASFVEQSRPGGITFAMQNILERHIDGTIGAKAAEYDGLMAALIADGRSNMEQKAFFFIAGFATINKKTGLPLLDPDRLSDYFAHYNTFPFIAYFIGNHHPQFEETSPGVFEPLWERDEDGKVVYDEKTKEPKPKKGTYKVNNFRRIYSQICQKDVDRTIRESKGKIGKGDPASFTGGKSTLAWIQTEVLLDGLYQNRIGKTSAAPKYDVDDYHVFGPSVRQKDMGRIISNGYGGGDATVERVKNIYPGFNNQILLLIKDKYLKTDKEDKHQRDYILTAILERMQSFTWMDGVVCGRFYNSNLRNAGYIRMSGNDFGTRAGVDGSKEVGEFAVELREFMKEICKDLDIISEIVEPDPIKRRQENEKLVDKIFNRRLPTNLNQTEYAAENAKFDEFGERLQRALRKKRERDPEGFDALLIRAAGKLSGSEAKALSVEEKAEAANRASAVVNTADEEGEAKDRLLRAEAEAARNNPNRRRPPVEEYEEEQFGPI